MRRCSRIVYKCVCESVCVCCVHVPWTSLACLTRGRGDDRVVCLARNSPHSRHPLYTHTPSALFRATHSCGNVSIVTAWTLYGQQLGAGIWAEALVCIRACAWLCVEVWVWVCVCGSSAVESAHVEFRAFRPQLFRSGAKRDKLRVRGQKFGSRGSVRLRD